jgi:hypothetical protein
LLISPYQIPGWSGLSNARVTIFGDVYPLPADEQVQCYLKAWNFPTLII